MRPGQRPPQRTVGGWRFRFRDVADAAGGHRVRGNVLRFGRASGYDGLAAGTDLDRSALPGQRASPQTQTGREERQPMAERSQALPAAAWREITIAQGSQGPRVYRFSAQRVRVTRRRKPGEVLWAVYRQNPAANPATICPTPPRTSLWRPWPTWAAPDGALKPSSRLRRAMWASTNTRPALGRVGITTLPCACWPGPSY